MGKDNFSYSNLGINLAVGFFVFVFGGYWIGKKLGNEKIGLMLGFLGGIIYWIYELSKVFKKMDTDK